MHKSEQMAEFIARVKESPDLLAALVHHAFDDYENSCYEGGYSMLLGFDKFVSSVESKLVALKTGAIDG